MQAQKKRAGYSIQPNMRRKYASETVRASFSFSFYYGHLSSFVQFFILFSHIFL